MPARLAARAINQDFSPIDLGLTLTGPDRDSYPDLVVTRTSRGHLADALGWLRLGDDAT